jgi:hypothetical protein
LFVELPRGVQIQRILRDRVAQSLAGNVSQRPLFPRVRYRKKYRSISPHKYKLIIVSRLGSGWSNRRRRLGLDDSITPPSISIFRIWDFRLNSLRTGIVFHGRRGTRQEKSAVKKRKEEWNLLPAES